MKKLVLYVSMAGLLLMPLGNFLLQAQPVEASQQPTGTWSPGDPTGQWVDEIHVNISDGGNTESYWDGAWSSGTWRYTPDGKTFNPYDPSKNSSCESELAYFPGHNGSLLVPSPNLSYLFRYTTTTNSQGVTSCVAASPAYQPVSLTGTWATWLSWADPNDIDTADGKFTFSYDSASKTYLTGTSSSTCRTELSNISANKSTGQLMVSEPQSSYDNNTFNELEHNSLIYFHTAIGGFSPGPNNCVDTRTITVTLGSPQLAASGPNPTSSPSPGGGSSPDTCNAGPATTWLICGFIIKPLSAAIDGISSFIQDLLKVTPLEGGSSSPTYQTWVAFRNIANVFFVLIFMIILAGTAVGYNLEAYTVKKALPRLVAAAILVQASFFLGQIGIDIGNILGEGVKQIFATVAPGQGIDFSNGGGGISSALTAALAAGAVAGIASAITGISMVAIVVAVIAVLVVIFTLILRQALLILLIVIAPVAIVAWILPNTERLFRMWYTNLIKLILMYPLIMALLGAGRLFAHITSASIPANPSSAQQAGAALSGVIEIVAAVAPLFLIPATFRASGALMGAVAKGASSLGGRSSKGVQGSKFAANRAENRQRRALAAATMDPGKNPLSRARKRFGSARAGFGYFPGDSAKRKMAGAADKINTEQETEALAAYSAENVSPQTGAGVDRLVNDLNNSKSAGQRRAAVKLLSQSAAGRTALAANRDKFTGPSASPADRTFWGQATDANKSELWDKSPDVLGGQTAFDHPTAKAMAGWDRQTLDRAYQYWNSLGATASPRVEAREASRQLLGGQYGGQTYKGYDALKSGLGAEHYNTLLDTTRL